MGEPIVEPIELTEMQRSQLKVLETQVRGLDLKQAQQLLLRSVHQGMVKDNIISRYISINYLVSRQFPDLF